MLTELLPKTLRNTMFVVGIAMLSVSGAIEELDGELPTGGEEVLQCQVEPSLSIEEVAGLS